MSSRGIRRALTAFGLSIGVVLASASSASAATTVGAWNFEEPPGAPTAVDASGYGQSGAVGSDISTGVRYDGATAYRFPTWASSPAGHEVLVPHSTRLEPGTGSFAVSVRLRTARYASNVVQKGQSGTPGGYWKVEIHNGRVTCHFTNSSGRTAAVTSTVRMDDGRWHSVRCGRSGSTVSLYVDGAKQGSRTGLTGSVSNAVGLAIGGKSRCDDQTVGCDFFAGDIDYVRVQKG